jgi:hypothetical protein
VSAFAIDLPRPPSKNRTHRAAVTKSGRPYSYRHVDYLTWINDADKIYFSLGLNRGREPIRGEFDLAIYYSKHRIGRIDKQNIIDAACDWLEHVGVVENDKHLRCLKLEPGDIGDDVRLVVEPLP